MKTLKTLFMAVTPRGGICLSLLLMLSGVSYGQSCADGSSSYTDDVLPILSAKCGGCHTTSSTSGFNLSTYAGLLAGGTNCGAGVTPGNAGASSLIDKTQWINTGGMPACGGNNMPTSGTPLTAAEFALIEAWINAGAQENCPAPVPCDLYIGGVLDGPLTGGTPKGVQLCAANDIADLSIYGVGSANNGGGSDGEEFTLPAVPLAAGECIWIASDATEFENFFGAGCAPDYVDGAVNVNGDDAIELFENGTVIDVYGDINTDGTGQPWEYMDGWATATDTDCNGGTFTGANWTYSGINALDGETDNGTAANPYPNPPACTVVCDLVLVAGTATCDTETAGMDAYTATFTFTDADGMGTYTVTASQGTPDMTTVTNMTSGTITVTGATEGTDVVLTVTDGADCNEMVTVTTPTCDPTSAGCVPIVITEVMYDPCSGAAGTNDCMGGAGTYWDDEANGEWVEIYNYGTDPLDVSGYLIGDSAASDVYEIPPGTIIQPGDYLVIGQEDIATCMAAAGINAVVGCDPGNCPTPQGGNRFNNGGDDVEFTAPDGTVCDIITYDAADCSGNNDGYTYSLIADPATFVDGTENDLPAAYGVSLNGGNVATFGGGSPGVLNTLGSCVTNLAESVVATCNGTDASFDISFDYTEGNVTDYDIYVDGVLNATLAGYPTGDQTAQTGTITIPNSTTATSITVEIRPTGADANICFEETITVDIPACVACAIEADLMAAPAAPVVVESTCQADGMTVDGGSIAAITCPTGATAEYSIDGGTTWVTTVPTYDQTTAVTVTVRCLCDEDMSTASPTAEVTTIPGECVVTCAIEADLMAAPAAPVVVESTCQADGTTVDGGSIAVTTCPTGATAEYSIDGGTTWTTTVPTYDQTNAVTVSVRCLCDEDMMTASPVATVTTVPGACACDISNTVFTQTCTGNGEEYELCVSFDYATPGASGQFNVYLDPAGTGTPATIVAGPYTYAAYDAAIAGGATCFTIPAADYAGDASDLEAALEVCIGDADAPAPGTGLPPGTVPMGGGIPTFACPQIYGILHNACAPVGGDEGPNEFVVIVNGADPTDVSSIIVDTPSGSDYDDFNTVTPPASWTCPCCVYLDETGTIPAGGVVVATSAMNQSTLDFTSLCGTAGTIYVVQDDGVGSTGHFSNSSPRTTLLNITGTASCDGSTSYTYTNSDGNDGDYTTFNSPDSPTYPAAGNNGVDNASTDVVNSSGDCTPQIAPAQEIECFACTTLDEVACAAACPVVTTPLATTEDLCDFGMPALDATTLVLDDPTLATADMGGAVLVTWYTASDLMFPFGGTADYFGTGGDGCNPVDLTIYAAIECAADNTLIPAGETTVTIFPPYLVPTIINDDCMEPTLSGCPNYVITPDPANPAAPGPGMMATFNFTIEYNGGPGGTSCFSEVEMVNVNCPAAGCPSVTPIDVTETVCDGSLAGEITAWQGVVEANATNTAAIADANTDAAVIYSTDAPADVSEATPPTPGTATGVHSGADLCAAETQMTFAYLLCFGDDGVAGGGDDSYLALGMNALTVYPEVQATTEAMDATTCMTTITPGCTGDTFGAATNATGGADAANWDAATSTYQAAPGEAAGTLDVMVTSGIAGSTCPATTITVNTTGCAATGMPMVMIDKNDADNTDDTQEVASGADATFTITVTNNGTVDLENVTVTDAMTPGCDIVLTATEIMTVGNGDAVFNPGESYTYTCMTTGGLTAAFTNSATVDANEVGDPMSTVDDTDDTEVTIQAVPMCSITATVVAECDDQGTIEEPADDVTTYTIIVSGSNTGATFDASIAPDGGTTTGLVYGTAYNYTVTGTGGLSVTFTDIDDSNCTTTVMESSSCSMVADIPTVGEWGLIILALLMSIVAIVGIRERKASEVNA